MCCKPLISAFQNKDWSIACEIADSRLFAETMDEVYTVFFQQGVVLHIGEGSIE